MERAELINTSIGPPGDVTSVVKSHFKNSTYTIVSKVAYLIGVSLRIFENEYEPPKFDIFQELERDKNARIVRNLCRLRTAIELNFRAINTRMIQDYKSLYSLPELVPIECIDQLSADGISITKSNRTLIQYIIEINRLLSDRINNCKEVFPIWINWTYIRDIFIMPDGLNEAGAAEAAAVYYEYKRYYPYQLYINWPPSDEGNILYCDKKFVTLLYHWHRDEFTDYSKVSDAGDATKGGIYDFLQDSEKTVIVVDCENSDPYKLCATLRNLDEHAMNKIVKIILYDDVHSASAWSILGTYIKTPVEHILIERVKQNKSLVDIRLTGGAFREFYQNHVDSFIIASSDSDYWGLISSLPEARFLVMVEHEKCGPDIKAALASSGIFYCYLDDFYSGNANDLKLNALIREVYRYLDRSFRLNVNDMMEEAYRITRAEMSDAEKRQFFNKYIKPMHLVIGKDGNVSIELKSK
jgi:hypothetical protein